MNLLSFAGIGRRLYTASPIFQTLRFIASQQINSHKRLKSKTKRH